MDGRWSVTGYTVDLRLLQDTTDKIAKLVRDLTTAIEAVHSEVAAPCAAAFQGEAGDAMQSRHAEWSDRISLANAELAQLKVVAETAFNNYSAAKAANLAMLRP